MNDVQKVEHELSLLIHRHGWLDGPTFAEITQRVCAAYFDDAPVLVDAAAALNAARAEAAR